MSYQGRYHQNSSAVKTLGAIYTPPHIAATLVRWAVRSPASRVLDPACGAGVFLAATRNHLTTLGNSKPACVGIDIDPQAAARSGGVCQDFFAWAEAALADPACRFDAIVGNPPYIRSHLFDEESRSRAFHHMHNMMLPPSRLMSSWLPFVAVSCRLLAAGGRLAFVLPEELLHISCAAGLRQFLLAHFRQVLVCFPPRSIFPTVQQSVILLLCDSDGAAPPGLAEITFADLEAGQSDPPDPAPPWEWLPKWTHLFLRADERQAVGEIFRLPGWKPLSSYGRVEVGVVTGANDFFVVSQEQTQQAGHAPYFVPVMTGARQLRGIDLTADDFRLLVEQGKRAFLLATRAPADTLPATLQTYLQQGEEAGISGRFKCRNRLPWYGVPAVWPADALLLRQAGDIPRLVSLSYPCTATDTLHRVRWTCPALGRRHVVSFLNVWTLLICELSGRSYGGGVLELMPREANTLLLPPPFAALDGIFAAVDHLLRLRRPYEAIELVSRMVGSSEGGPPFPLPYNDALALLLRLIRRRKG
jgi:tRNA1(Val) A37 N6-methylase TrmN6